MPTRCNPHIISSPLCSSNDAESAELRLSTSDAAQLYAATQRFYCFPLRTGTRRGHLSKKNRHVQLNWGASNDPRVLKYYFEDRFKDAELGIATGELSGIFVLDVDVPKAGKPGKDGPTSLAVLVSEYGPLSLTLTARTPSGGLHYFFQHPGFLVKNSVGMLGAINRLSSGLDIRGDGGMVVAAPSKGRVWIDYSCPIARAPDYLLDWLRKRPSTSSPRIGRVPHNSSIPPPIVIATNPELREALLGCRSRRQLGRNRYQQARYSNSSPSHSARHGFVRCVVEDRMCHI
ncbi:bifunctional DNA primase/polymerase [Tardiphaga sp. vice304]|uniref:bifunctional DNA primase/polymerase n=1 Tax=Tardiphaga sp. vice304 TaxID=2592817 RepID=UPI001161FB67|nr:bifunctional DNA primase/polymerase [Tardiphaga sp. vice304]